jgi:hypothetical protein
MEYWNTTIRKRSFKILFVGFLLTHSLISAQTISTYSGLGLGDIIRPAFSNHIGNGLGLSKGEYWFVNQMNPALLPYNQVTTFQAGLGFETKTVSQNDLQDTYSSFNLLYLGTAIPAKAGKWTFAFGVQPYSRVLYNFATSIDIPGSGVTAEITNQGSGGFNQAYFSNGFKIWKNLSLGIKVSYLFSSLIKESTTIIGDTLDPSRSARSVLQRTNAKDVIFSTGISYKHNINKDISANYGITFDPETKISAERFERIDIRTPAGTVLDIDTVANNLSGSFRLPQKWGAGISFNEGFKWSFGAEVEYQQWSRFKDFSGNNDYFQDGFSIRVGGDIVPNPIAIENYLNRITYRLGLSYDKLPFTISGKDIAEYGVNFGWSMPVSRISYIDFGMRYAVRGSTRNNLIKENYFQLHLGFTFNDRWFLRTAYD